MRWIAAFFAWLFIYVVVGALLGDPEAAAVLKKHDAISTLMLVIAAFSLLDIALGLRERK